MYIYVIFNIYIYTLIHLVHGCDLPTADKEHWYALPFSF